MEKIIYALQGAELADPAEAARKFTIAGARHVRINLHDEAVAPAADLAQDRGTPLPNAIVQAWLPSANPLFRGDLDKAISALCESHSAWLVSESNIIDNQTHPPVSSERTYGYSQMAFLTLPEGMDWADWRRIWRDGHTQLAIDTQSNFEYVQNLVVEPLTDKAPLFIAIVEECFPPEAMTDPLVFFDAAGDQAKFDRNLAAMMESCGRFITPGTIDVIPTSQYDFT